MKKRDISDRDRKHHKKKHGMRVKGRSILDILRIQRKRAEAIKHAKEIMDPRLRGATEEWLREKRRKRDETGKT